MPSAERLPLTGRLSTTLHQCDARRRVRQGRTPPTASEVSRTSSTAERHRSSQAKSGIIAWHTDNPTVTSRPVERQLRPLLDEIGQERDVTSVVDAYQPSASSQISADGTTAYATVTFAPVAVNGGRRVILINPRRHCSAGSEGRSTRRHHLRMDQPDRCVSSSLTGTESHPERNMRCTEQAVRSRKTAAIANGVLSADAGGDANAAPWSPGMFGGT